MSLTGQKPLQAIGCGKIAALSHLVACCLAIKVRAVEKESDDDLDTSRGGRLEAAMALSKCKRAELAHLCGVSERQISRYRAGHPIPSDKLQIICDRCGVSERYLMFGDRSLPPSEKPRLVSERHKDVLPIGQRPMIGSVPVHKFHIALLRHIRALPVETRISALDHIINSRWSGTLDLPRGECPILDGAPMDRYETAAVLALRAIEDVGEEIALINRMLSIKAKEI